MDLQAGLKQRQGGLDAELERAVSQRVTVDSHGNIFAVGEFEGTTSFGSNGAGTFTSVYNPTSQDYYENAYAAEYDSNGNWLAAATLQTSPDSYGNAIALGSDGSVYITGEQGILPQAPLTSEYFVPLVAKWNAKLSPGSAAVTTNLGNSVAGDDSEGESIAIGYGGQVYVAGYTYASAAAGATPVPFAFVTGLDPVSLTPNWVARTWPVSSGAEALASFVAAAPGGSLYLTGWFNDAVNFDPADSPSVAANTLSTKSPAFFVEDLSVPGSSTTLTSSLDPSMNGQQVTLTAHVVAAGGKKALGSVRFLWGSPSALLGTATLDSSGNARLNYSFTVGTYPIQAVYDGSSTLLGSTSNSLTQVVNAAPTKTTVKASAKSAVYGNQVTFTATVIAPVSGTGIPAGNVTFMDGSTPLGTVALNSKGIATLATSTLGIGPHDIVAIFQSNSSFAQSQGAVSVTIREGGQEHRGRRARGIDGPRQFHRVTPFLVSLSFVTAETTPRR